MSADVVHLPHQPPASPALMPLIAAIVEESNETQLGLLTPYYEKASHLLSEINALDCMQKEALYQRDRSFTHVHRESDHVHASPLFSPPVLALLTVSMMVGEFCLAKIVSAIYGSPNLDSWLIAIGMVAVTTAGSALTGYGGKTLCDTWFHGRRFHPSAFVSLISGIVLLVCTVWAMMYARSGYFTATEGQEDGIPAGMATILNSSATALQIAIAIALCGLCWLKTSSGAKSVYAKRQKRVQALLEKRAKLESELTCLYRTLEADWNRTIAHYKRIIYVHIDELHLRGVEVPSFSVPSNLFAPLPAQILAAQSPDSSPTAQAASTITAYPEANDNLDVLSGKTRRPRLM